MTSQMTTSVDCGAYGGIGTLTYTFYKGTTPQSNMMTMVNMGLFELHYLTLEGEIRDIGALVPRGTRY